MPEPTTEERKGREVPSGDAKLDATGSKGARFQEAERNAQDWIKYSQYGIQLAATVVGLALAGHWLDDTWGFDRPWMTLAGSLLGIAVGLTQFLRSVSRHQRQKHHRKK